MLPGFISHVCDAPSMPAPVRDVIAVGFDIKRESSAAMTARDEHDELAEKAAQRDAHDLATEFVKGNLAAGDDPADAVDFHRAEVARLQRKVNGLEAAKPRIINEIRSTVTKYADEWKSNAAAEGEAFLLDLAAALSMTREAAERGRHSMGALSALDDFEGRQEGPYAGGTSVGNLRVMPRAPTAGRSLSKPRSPHSTTRSTSPAPSSTIVP